MSQPLKPRKGAYVVLVFQVTQEAGEDGELGIRAVNRDGDWVATEALTDEYAIIVGHPLEALGAYPAPERYTPEGINRPGVSWGHVAVPSPGDAPVLTEEIISDLADKARELVHKRLTFQAAMEQGARDAQ